jgi:hypothetical protein
MTKSITTAVIILLCILGGTFAYWFLVLKDSHEATNTTVLQQATDLNTAGRHGEVISLLAPVIKDPNVTPDEKARAITPYGYALVQREWDKGDAMSYTSQQTDTGEALKEAVAVLEKGGLSPEREAGVYNFIVATALGYAAQDTIKPLADSKIFDSLYNKMMEEMIPVAPPLVATSTHPYVGDILLGFIADESIARNPTKVAFLAKIRGLDVYRTYIENSKLITEKERAARIKPVAQEVLDAYTKMYALKASGPETDVAQQLSNDVAKWYRIRALNALGVSADDAIADLRNTIFASYPSIPGVKNRVAFLRGYYVISLYEKMEKLPQTADNKKLLVNEIKLAMNPVLTDKEFLGDEYKSFSRWLSTVVIPMDTNGTSFYIRTFKKSLILLAQNDPASAQVLTKMGLK